MAQKSKAFRDPWREMSREQENDQVELDEVLRRFHVEDGSAQALKKALLARVTQLTRTR